MEIHEDTAGQISIGFPLGLALLVALFFSISCFLCCCLHWDKLQSLFPSSRNTQAHIQPQFTSSHHKPGFPVLVINYYNLFKRSLYLSWLITYFLWCCYILLLCSSDDAAESWSEHYCADARGWGSKIHGHGLSM